MQICVISYFNSILGDYYKIYHMYVMTAVNVQFF